MSKDNHPNFHAVKFATDITASLLDSVRGRAKELGVVFNNDFGMHEDVLNFVEKIENKIDQEVAKRTPEN